MRRKQWRPELSIPYWVELKTMQLWLTQGSVRLVEEGEENIYAVNEFGHLIFAKYN